MHWNNDHGLKFAIKTVRVIIYLEVKPYLFL